MITTLCWIPRGVADSQPQVVKVKAEKPKNTPKVKEEEEEVNEKMDEEDKVEEEDDDIVKKYGLDKYDEEDEEGNYLLILYNFLVINII